MTYNNIWSLETKGILVSFRTFYAHALDVRLKNNASGRLRRLDFDLTWGWIKDYGMRKHARRTIFNIAA
jgi:hypothetical protein